MHMASNGPQILTPSCSAGPKPVVFSVWRSLEACVFAFVACANPKHAKKHLRLFSYTIKPPVSPRSHSAQKRHMRSLTSGWDPWTVLQSDVQCHLLPVLVTKQGPLMRILLLSLYWFLSFSSLARSCWHVARATSKTWILSSSSLSRSESCWVKSFPSGYQTGWDSARLCLLHSSSNLACSSSTCCWSLAITGLESLSTCEEKEFFTQLTTDPSVRFNMRKTV